MERTRGFKLSRGFSLSGLSKVSLVTAVRLCVTIHPIFRLDLPLVP